MNDNRTTLEQINDNLARYEMHGDHGDLPKISARKALAVVGCLIVASWIIIGAITALLMGWG